MTTATDMINGLVRLREGLLGVSLPLDLPKVEQHRTSRRELLDQIEDYALPRLMSIDAPLLTVVGGSTGAGKSTLVNSLVGERVTEPGVLRPTTRSPVLIHHPHDAEWFREDRILPDLARTDRSTGDPRALQLVSSESIPAGIAVLDAPDVDSVDEGNRLLAAQLLGAADLWLFVTSAARYADQVPWDYLRAAAERSTAVAVVLDRTPANAISEIRPHLTTMLNTRGLKDSPLFIVEEGKVDEDGLLPAEAVAEIRGWLESLAADAEARAAIVRRTLEGAIRTIAARSYDVSQGAAEQSEMVDRLRADAVQAYADAITAVDGASADGTLLRGEVLARWQEFVGTGELLKSLESKVGWLRDKVVGWAKGKPTPAERVTVAVESGLESLITEHAEAAAERATASWRSLEAGRHLVEDSGKDLGRASRDFRARAERTVRDWQHSVMNMVRVQGQDKRSTARFLALGVNGLSVALMVVVFSSTGGVTGAEIGIAGGSAVLGQKLLEAVFGDQAVRTLADNARSDLHRRVAQLLGEERGRFTETLDALGIDPGSATRLREDSRKIDDLRFARQVAEELG